MTWLLIVISAVGLKAIAPDWQWVDVVNPGVRGEVCGIAEGMPLKVVAEHDNQYLVEVQGSYIRPGTLCDPDVLFFIAKDVYEQFTQEYQERQKQHQARDALIEQLLQQHD